MAVTFKNRICTCGYKRFRERRYTVSQDVLRWMQFTTSPSGMGSTPMGTGAGTGSAGSWGEFESTLRTTSIEVICESCRRVRSTKSLGGIAVFTSYVEAGYLYIVASDAGNVSCFSLRFVGDMTYKVVLEKLDASPPVILVETEPETSAASPPAGAELVDTLLRARLPEVADTATYSVELIDNCAGYTYDLTDVDLEAPPMILTPLNADLGGAPIDWLYGQQGYANTGQPASGSRLSIPFDKCMVVHEYDARLGSVPADQDWTHQGTGVAGDFALVEGGALRAITTLDSYWEQSTIITSDPDVAFAYASVLPITSAVYAAEQDGVLFGAVYSKGVASPYHGVRFNLAEQWYTTSIDGSADSLVSYKHPVGWTMFAATDGSEAGPEQIWADRAVAEEITDIFGTDTASGTFNVISQFGNITGTSFDVLIRNYVASYGGRFIRPVFTSFTQVSTPVVRLYMVADANSSATKTARFKVTYGVATGDPYLVPSGEQSITRNFTDANSVYEIGLELSGLTANLPFWFSVERDWSHGEDLLEATVHMIQATVRSQ